MSDINLYLTNLATDLTLSPRKKDKIEDSISSLKKRLWGEFQEKLSDVGIFGSFDRETIIPADKDLDVDILIIFKKAELQPKTYLSQLRSFCEKSYSTSEIYPDHPTVALQLDHVKFELVPTYNTSEALKIPAPYDKELKWISASPQDFKKKVIAKDKSNKGLIIPLIRIIKYWNIIKEKPFASFDLEKFAIEKLYDCSALRDYYFSLSNSLETIAKTERQKTAITQLKENNRRLRLLESGKMLDYIEAEFAKFLPVLKK